MSCSIQWFAPQRAIFRTGPGPGWSQEPDIPTSSPTMTDVRTRVIFCSFPFVDLCTCGGHLGFLQFQVGIIKCAINIHVLILVSLYVTRITKRILQKGKLLVHIIRKKKTNPEHQIQNQFLQKHKLLIPFSQKLLRQPHK